METNGEPMARDWHETFKSWSKPPSDTEEDKAARAAGMIREAIRSHLALKNREIEVYATGSYANNTNVRLGSDMDVAIVLKDTFWYTLPDGVTEKDVGLGNNATYRFDDFRSDVHAALAAEFGNEHVKPRNKTIEIRASTARINADATPFLQHRRYTKRDSSGTWRYLQGSELRPQNERNRHVINWHRQHYENGVDKNRRTGRRYKRVVRILKNLSNDMASSDVQATRQAALTVPSFLIECLAYNAPDGKFNLSEGTYYDDVKAVVGWLWNQTKEGGDGTEFEEVSGLKWLFTKGQAWTMAQTHEFLLQAWRYVGF